MTPDQLRARTKRFALDVLILIKDLPTSIPAAVISKQLVRCATSVGANYRACCPAKSQADFAAKAAIVEEEADECMYWLELLSDGGFLKEPSVHPLMIEVDELTRIMRASRMTARGNAYRR